MSSISTTFVILVVAAFVVMQCTSQQPAVFPATEDEIKMCEAFANEEGKTMKEARKERRLSCNFMCVFDDETDEKMLSPDGQECCDMGGLSTGTCKDGNCKVNVMG